MQEMQTNDQFEIILLKYIVDEADLPEREIVERWLNESEQNQEEYKRLKLLWRLGAVIDSSNRIDALKEWQSFKAKYLQTPKNVFSTQIESRSSLPEVLAAPPSNVRRLLVTTSFAASIFILIAVGAWWLNSNTVKPSIVADGPVMKLDSVHAPMKTLVNNGDKTKMFVLPDGSNVELYSRSEVAYAEPFLNDKRVIRLTGKAFFKIAQDKTRPFTVFCSDISTTVLGTQFTVTSYPADENVSVRLFEGKVLVQSTPQQNKFAQDYHLVPGDQFVYSRKTFLAKVITSSGCAVSGVAKVNDRTGVDNPMFPRHKSGHWYMFNNQRLPQVFAQLKALYGTEIIYNKKALEQVYFIGEFNREDALEKVLQEIAASNGFKITKQGDKFVVTE